MSTSILDFVVTFVIGLMVLVAVVHLVKTGVHSIVAVAACIVNLVSAVLVLVDILVLPSLRSSLTLKPVEHTSFVHSGPGRRLKGFEVTLILVAVARLQLIGSVAASNPLAFAFLAAMDDIQGSASSDAALVEPDPFVSGDSFFKQIVSYSLSIAHNTIFHAVALITRVFRYALDIVGQAISDNAKFSSPPHGIAPTVIDTHVLQVGCLATNNVNQSGEDAQSDRVNDVAKDGETTNVDADITLVNVTGSPVKDSKLAIEKNPALGAKAGLNTSATPFTPSRLFSFVVPISRLSSSAAVFIPSRMPLDVPAPESLNALAAPFVPSSFHSRPTALNPSCTEFVPRNCLAARATTKSIIPRPTFWESCGAAIPISILPPPSCEASALAPASMIVEKDTSLRPSISAPSPIRACASPVSINKKESVSKTMPTRSANPTPIDRTLAGSIWAPSAARVKTETVSQNAPTCSAIAIPVDRTLAGSMWAPSSARVPVN